MTPCRPRPCSSCPYVVSTPSGLWHPDEYRKLPAWDRDTPDQPAALFMCHQGLLGEQLRVCRGWLQVHRDTALGVRVGLATGELDPDEVWADTPGVAYHPTGTAACVHGLAGVDNPGPDACKAIDRLTTARDRQEHRH